jgi:predicted GNAT family N-acyltransferase
VSGVFNLSAVDFSWADQVMSQEEIRVRLGSWEDLREEASVIRFEVFVQEQQVPLNLELDEMDALSLHAVALDAQGEVIATGRLLPDGHIGRMAVRQSERKKGVGAHVLRSLMEAAKLKGYAEVVLGAQIHAKGFYERHGFAEFGEVFMDANIPHVMMKKSLAHR